MSKTKVICIGDPHIQTNNIPEFNMFIEKLLAKIIEIKPDFVCILGDVLHTHERLHTLALNKAYEFINKVRQLTKTFVLVGNHDMCNNQQFLSDNHWLNGMKEWENVTIVDRVISFQTNSELFVFAPYVPNGRFKEALNTIGDIWKTSKCIFAHQEFFGCKMGAITSEEGDKWDLSLPDVVSGHIHSRQKPQDNIYYTGSALQHAFGESKKNIIASLTFYVDQDRYVCHEIDLKLPRKQIIYMDVEDVYTYTKKQTNDKIKLTINGNYEEFKTFKKSQQYKQIVEDGTKVVFKHKKLNEIQHKKVESSFNEILNNLILNEKDVGLYQAYDFVFNDSVIDIDDIMFL